MVSSVSWGGYPPLVIKDAVRENSRKFIDEFPREQFHSCLITKQEYVGVSENVVDPHFHRGK